MYDSKKLLFREFNSLSSLVVKAQIMISLKSFSHFVQILILLVTKPLTLDRFVTPLQTFNKSFAEMSTMRGQAPSESSYLWKFATTLTDINITKEYFINFMWHWYWLLYDFKKRTWRHKTPTFDIMYYYYYHPNIK